MGTSRPPVILDVDQAVRHRVWAFRASCVICRRGRTIPVLLAYRWLGPGGRVEDIKRRFHCKRCGTLYGDVGLGIDVEVIWPRPRFWRDKASDIQGRGPCGRGKQDSR